MGPATSRSSSTPSSYEARDCRHLPGSSERERSRPLSCDRYRVIRKNGHPFFQNILCSINDLKHKGPFKAILLQGRRRLMRPALRLLNHEVAEDLDACDVA